jgi:alpha-amylase
MGDAQKSWWSHFEEHVPRLSLMGVTHVWLPPPNKGSNKVGSLLSTQELTPKVYKLGRGYDAYDLV